MSQMTKQDYIIQLQKESQYSDEWIQEAAEILEICNTRGDRYGVVSLFFMTSISADHLKYLNTALKDPTVDNDHILLPITKKLNSTQARLYYYAVSKFGAEIAENFLDPSIPYSKMNTVIAAMDDGDFKFIEYLTDHNYSPDQVFQLLSGLKNGVDYTKYADPNIPPVYMSIMLHALVEGKMVCYNPEGKLEIWDPESEK